MPYLSLCRPFCKYGSDPNLKTKRTPSGNAAQESVISKYLILLLYYQHSALEYVVYGIGIQHHHLVIL